MRTTHDAILAKIDERERELEWLASQLKKVKDEPDQKECPNCKTNNYHYYPTSDSWCCACC